jgi:hypothetical protein
MTATPFDAAIEAIAQAGYHNHRLETHSDLVSDGFVHDLSQRCHAFRADLDRGTIRVWKNVPSPGDRRRRVDLFIGEPGPEGLPDPARVRIAIENKSVITAHRNRTNRFDDLAKVLSAVQSARPEAILIATVLVGTADRVLNVPDHVKKIYQNDETTFAREVRPRLSSGDETLLSDFHWAVSHNARHDPGNTVELFRSLPTRGVAQTHVQGFDSVLIVPVAIDNIHPPRVERINTLGIDVDADYAAALERTCRAYTARYHM